MPTVFSIAPPNASTISRFSAPCYALVSLESSNRASAIASIVGSLVVLYFLFGTEKAKQIFAR